MYASHTRLVLITICALIAGAALVQEAAAQGRCANPNRKSGLCVSIYQCPTLLEVIKKISLSSDELRFLRESQCVDGYGNPPYVCCTTDRSYSNTPPPPPPPRPTPPPSTVGGPTRSAGASVSPSNGEGNVLPEPPRCGHNSLGDRIYNGNETALDQYPWMVLLEYTDRKSRPVLNCGGSLINQRYVLTAAHCVVGEIETQVGPLSRVRLGEYDISREIDCVAEDCNNKVLEVGFEEVIPHPQYDVRSQSRHHDIALIRLAQDVAYTDFIRPVCLPLPNTRRDIAVGELLTVAGWGRTLLARQSNVKMHLFVPVNDPNACAEKFRTRKVNLIGSQLCAGGEFAKDSCDGDSGGPLMRKGHQSRWYLEGIVSFGNRCGLEGWPGVYTRVADYIDWIQASLRP